MEIIDRRRVKKIGKAIKSRQGNFRIEKIKVDKDSNVASVELGAWIDSRPYESIGASLRHFNTIWYGQRRFLIGLGLESIFFIPSIPGNSNVKGSGFITIVVQFTNPNGLNRFLDEGVYDIVADCIIELVEDSKLIVLDK